MNNIPQDILDEIKSCCIKNPKIESCGIIFEYNNELQFLECDNLSEQPEFNFIVDPVILIKYDVKYIVHSHPTGSAQPSKFDIKSSNELCVPFLIYSICYDDFYLYENISV